MKLVRYGEAGKEKPGILDAQGAIRDLSGVVKDIDATTVSPEGIANLRGVNVDSLPKVSGNPRLGAPIASCRMPSTPRWPTRLPRWTATLGESPMLTGKTNADSNLKRRRRRRAATHDGSACPHLNRRD